MSSRAFNGTTVAGLHVCEWSGTGPAVLGLPGLTSTARVWQPLADGLTALRVIAPDLRGRGGSTGRGGATGLRAHAHDVARIVEELDLRDVVVVGHSMGAFLAPLVAQELPGRVARLVLLDGGIPPRLPRAMGPRLTRLVFRRELRRLDRNWPDAATFTRKVLGRPLATRPDLLPQVTQWAEHDLTGRPGRLRPDLDREHVVADAVDTFFGADVIPALQALDVPAHLLAASRGKHDRAKPFLSRAVLEEWTARLPGLTAERVEANHLTILFSRRLLDAVQGADVAR